jgi:hypothetical protein
MDNVQNHGTCINIYLSIYLSIFLLLPLAAQDTREMLFHFSFLNLDSR